MIKSVLQYRSSTKITLFGDLGSNKPSLTNMSASSNISSPHPTSSCPLAHKVLSLFQHPIYFHSDEIYLIFMNELSKFVCRKWKLKNMTEEKMFDVCIIGAGVSGMLYVFIPEKKIRKHFNVCDCISKFKFQMRIKIQSKFG